MQNITHAEFVELVQTVRLHGASFIGLTTVTDVKLKGGMKNPLQGRVTKLTKNSNVMYFTNQNSNGYDNMVKRRLEREGKDPESFVLSPRVWGERVPNVPLVTHKGEYYLEVIFLRAGDVTYFVNGVETPKESIEGLETPAVSEESQGGLDNKVIIRTYKVSSLKEVVLNGETLVFID
jgi:hypothetical protein